VQNVELRVSEISSHWADGIVDQSDLMLDLGQEKAGVQFAARHYNQLRRPLKRSRDMCLNIKPLRNGRNQI
jgi:hypothetical protein